MRIIAGKLKGANLYIPKNRNTRTLKDLARESIFNLLIHSNKIIFQFKNSKILDLYAGTGSFGLECLSRSASNVCFIEKEKDALDILEKNIQKLKLEHKTKIFSDDVHRLIEEENFSKLKFNLIFCDPPFKDTNLKKLIKLIFSKNLLEKNGIIVFHRRKNIKENLPSCFRIIDERTYGTSKITFGKFLS